DRAISRFGYPFVLRGTAGCAGSQVRLVSSLHEASAALQALKLISPGEPFAQAFVRGTRHLVGGFFSHGEAICLFPQETIEAHPPLTGPSVRVRAYVNETLLRAARTLFADLRWTGMACAEFIRDERGNFLLLEMNPRPWAALEIAERSGARICRAFAESLAGRSAHPPARYRTGVSDIVLEGFLMARRGREGGIGSTLRTLRLREWLDCCRAVPWGRPRLALHVLRRLYRELARDRPKPKATESLAQEVR
ncbi:MAG TPA: ATP-grasp domain-containing protein, partial [Steroidobacteraceae bacterium]|nr:ATP-grasp domain-containing protein [Steroidobacteraceae bacterium]